MPAGRFLSLVYAVCLFCAGLAAWVAGSFEAVAQTSARRKVNGPPTQVPGKGAAFISTNWSVGCQPNQRTKKMLCQLSKAILIAKSRQLLMRAVIGPMPHRLVLQLPHGLDIKAGVRVQIDKKPARALPFNTSNSQGIYSNTALSGTLLALMRKGGSVTVTVKAINGRKIIMPLSLDGFSIAFDKLK